MCLSPAYFGPMISPIVIIIPRSKGSGNIAMSLGSVRRLSVPPSVNLFVSAQLLEYRSEYFDDTSQLCRTGHDDVSCTKNERSRFITFF